MVGFGWLMGFLWLGEGIKLVFKGVLLFKKWDEL
jgi:hypothetical protein